jgi:hypothetical protein
LYELITNITSEDDLEVIVDKWENGRNDSKDEVGSPEHCFSILPIY